MWKRISQRLENWGAAVIEKDKQKIQMGKEVGYISRPSGTRKRGFPFYWQQNQMELMSDWGKRCMVRFFKLVEDKAFDEEGTRGLKNQVSCKLVLIDKALMYEPSRFLPSKYVGDYLKTISRIVPAEHQDEVIGYLSTMAGKRKGVSCIGWLLEIEVGSEAEKYGYLSRCFESLGSRLAKESYLLLVSHSIIGESGLDEMGEFLSEIEGSGCSIWRRMGGVSKLRIGVGST